jgi:hypothetical protein
MGKQKNSPLGIISEKKSEDGDLNEWQLSEREKRVDRTDLSSDEPSLYEEDHFDLPKDTGRGK